MKTCKTLYRGWWIAIAGFLLMGLVYAPAVNMAGLHVVPLQQAFSVARTAAVVIMALSTVGSMTGAFLAGKLLAAFGIRRVMVLSAVGVAGSYIGMSMVRVFAWLHVLSLCRGFFVALLTVVPISVLISGWFREKRGKAMGVAMMGSGLLPLVLNPLAVYIIGRFSWRGGYLFYALLAVLMLPVVALLPGKSPAPVEEHRASRPCRADKGVFWLVFLGMLLLGGVCQVWNSNGPSFLQDVGYGPQEIAALLSATSFGVTIGKPLHGAFADRFAARSSLGLGCSALFAGYLCMCVVPGVLPAAFAGAAVLGIGIATVTVNMPLITIDLFGMEGYAVLVGRVQMGISLGASIVPLLVSFMFERHGSYLYAWGAAICLSVMVFAFVWLAYKRCGRANALRGG